MKYFAHFVTPGELPLDSLTRFGINHKPNSSNPLGYFGTGLKYGVAIVHRLGGRVYLRTDKGQFEFYSKNEDFRGKDFQGIRMRRRNSMLARWTYDKLPFTTELGKNWEPWQAYREFISNTIDEGGGVLVDCAHETPEDPAFGRWRPGTSVLTIEMPNSDMNSFAQPDHAEKVHLPLDILDRGRVLLDNDLLTIHDRPSSYIYFKGVRVYDLPHRVTSSVTYNFKIGVTLSEDRSIRNQWEILRHIVMSLESLDFSTYERIMTAEGHIFEAQHLPMSPGDTTGFEKPNITRLSKRPSGYYAGSLWDHFNAAPKGGESQIAITLAAKGEIWLKLMNMIEEANREELVEVFEGIRNDPEIQALWHSGEYDADYPALTTYFN